MCEFKNIKVGDKVLVRCEVAIGWGNGKSFLLPRIVDKVTAKQFVIGNDRYKKKDGSKVSGRYNEKAIKYKEENNEIKERNKLVISVNEAYEVKKIIDCIKVSYNHKNLTIILEKLKDIEKLTEK